MSHDVHPKQRVLEDLDRCHVLLGPLVQHLRLVAAAIAGGPAAEPLAIDEILRVEVECVAALDRVKPLLPWIFEYWIPVDRPRLSMTTAAGLVVHFEEKRAYVEQVRSEIAATTLGLASVLNALRQRPEALRCVIVHINDTYLLEERPDRALPGFARAAATIELLRTKVRETIGERFLVLHSGDFLGPSRVGKHSRGSAMVRVLDKIGLDWCTLGNHEFDYGEKILGHCLGTAQFQVVLGNVETANVALQKQVLWPDASNPILAVTGVVSSSVAKSFPEQWGREAATGALKSFQATSAQAEFKVVLSHATLAEDRTLRKELPRDRWMVLGGHDHDIDYTSDDGAPIYKNLANLQTMRVLMLFAAGSSRIEELILAHDALLRKRCHARGVPPFSECPPQVKAQVTPRYPDDCELVLSALPALDAKLLRRHWQWEPGKWKQRSDPSLLMAILALPSPTDVSSFLFRYDDHLPPDAAVLEIVDSAVRACAAADESLVVRDQPNDPTDGFECRDEMIRKHPTAFGVLAAECVRRETGAQFVLLNSGSFRADSLLPGRLQLRDLLDCFLYDASDAVIVVELPRTSVLALVDHGKRCSGSGAYPQVSPATPPEGEVLRVAISAYLLTNHRSIDGYDETLADSLGVPLSDVHARISGAILGCTGLVKAIKAHAQGVELPHLGSAPIERWTAAEFVLLARPFLERAAKIGLGNQTKNIVGHDGPLADAQLTKCRTAIRAWVIALYEDTRGKSAVASASGDPSIDWFERITAIIRELEVHPDWFTKKISYASLLDGAAHGIGGWLN